MIKLINTTTLILFAFFVGTETRALVGCPTLKQLHAVYKMNKKFDQTTFKSLGYTWHRAAGVPMYEEIVNAGITKKEKIPGKLHLNKLVCTYKFTVGTPIPSQYNPVIYTIIGE